MPIYNSQRYLRQAVESILGQTFIDFELLAFNNASTDQSREILDEYAAADSRVHIYDQPDREYIFALIKGFSLASGAYIARMDADDVARPERLGLQFAFMESHPEIALIGGQIMAIDGQGNDIRLIDFPLQDEEIRKILPRYNCFSHPAVMLRKAAYDAVGGYRLAFYYAEDYDLWLRLSEKFALANLPEVILNYRVHVEQVSASRRDQQIVSAIGAQYAAQCRKVGKPDPTDGLERISPEHLSTWGISPSTINKFHMEEDIWWSRLLFEAGNTQPAQAILESALARSPLRSLETEQAQRAANTYIQLYSSPDNPLYNFGRTLYTGIRQPLILKKTIQSIPQRLLQLGGAEKIVGEGFSERNNGNYIKAYRLFHLAVKKNPLYLFNKGVLSVLVESLIGRSRMKRFHSSKSHNGNPLP